MAIGIVDCANAMLMEDLQRPRPMEIEEYGFQVQSILDLPRPPVEYEVPLQDDA